MRKRCKVCQTFLTRKNQNIGLCSECRFKRKSNFGSSVHDEKSIADILCKSLSKYSQMDPVREKFDFFEKK